MRFSVSLEKDPNKKTGSSDYIAYKLSTVGTEGESEDLSFKRLQSEVKICIEPLIRRILSSWYVWSEPDEEEKVVYLVFRAGVENSDDFRDLQGWMRLYYMLL